MYREITGKEAPPTPISARQYAGAGLPWFDLNDETKGEIAPAGGFGGVKSVKEMDQEKGLTAQQVGGPIADPQVVKLHHGVKKVIEGEW